MAYSRFFLNQAFGNISKVKALEMFLGEFYEMLAGEANKYALFVNYHNLQVTRTEVKMFFAIIVNLVTEVFFIKLF